METLIFLVTECLARHEVDALPDRAEQQGHGITVIPSRSQALSESFAGSTQGKHAAG